MKKLNKGQMYILEKVQEVIRFEARAALERIGAMGNYYEHLHDNQKLMFKKNEGFILALKDIEFLIQDLKGELK